MIRFYDVACLMHGQISDGTNRQLLLYIVSHARRSLYCCCDGILIFIFVPFPHWHYIATSLLNAVHHKNNRRPWSVDKIISHSELGCRRFTVATNLPSLHARHLKRPAEIWLSCYLTIWGQQIIFVDVFKSRVKISLGKNFILFMCPCCSLFRMLCQQQLLRA